MICKISDFIRNEHGKAESSTPMVVTIIICLGIAYWGYQYGRLHYYDYIFKSDLQNNVKYDAFKIRVKPSLEEQKKIFLRLAKKQGITLPEKETKQEFMKVQHDASEKWYTVHVRYKRIVKHPVGKPHVVYFEHKIYPR